MPPTNVKLSEIYNQSGKTDNLGEYGIGIGGNNFSLNTLIQAFSPVIAGGTASFALSGSGQFPSNLEEMILQANNGNLSGYPAGTGGGNYPPVYPQGAKNISLGDMDTLWDDNPGWDVLYKMYFKFVPTGWASNTTYNKHVGNYADAINRNLYKANSSASYEGSNYPGVNYGNYFQGPMNAPQSASSALRFNNSQSLSSTMPFTGCMTFTTSSATNPQYIWLGFNDGGNRLIPPGSGSYMIPAVLTSQTLPQNNQTAVHCFWVKCPLPTSIPGRTTMGVYSTQMSGFQGIPNNYRGVSAFIGGNGFIGMILGLGGSSSTDRRVVIGPSIDVDEWNFVCLRISSVVNYYNMTEFGNYIRVWRPSSGWAGGAFSWYGGSGNLQWSQNMGMVYNPRDFGTGADGNDNSEFSGSIGHHYIFWEDGVANVNKMGLDEMEMIRVMTNSGSYGLYTS